MTFAQGAIMTQLAAAATDRLRVLIIGAGHRRGNRDTAAHRVSLETALRPITKLLRNRPPLPTG
jgi:hypothetical protein